MTGGAMTAGTTAAVLFPIAEIPIDMPDGKIKCHGQQCA